MKTLIWSGKTWFHIECVLEDNYFQLFWHQIFVSQHHSHILYRSTFWAYTSKGMTLVSWQKTADGCFWTEFICIWQTEPSIHKKTTEIVIFSHYSQVLCNHSNTTSMTLQVTNRGFKGIASNSLVLLWTERTQKGRGTHDFFSEPGYF